MNKETSQKQARSASVSRETAGVYIRREEAARLLGVSVSTLRTWERSPQFRLRAQIIGRSAWHDRAKIVALARQRGRVVSDTDASVSVALASGASADQIVSEHGASYVQIAQLMAVRDALSARVSVERAWLLELARLVRSQADPPPSDPSHVSAWCQRLSSALVGALWQSAAQAAQAADRKTSP